MTDKGWGEAAEELVMGEGSNGREKGSVRIYCDGERGTDGLERTRSTREGAQAHTGASRQANTLQDSHKHTHARACLRYTYTNSVVV